MLRGNVDRRNLTHRRAILIARCHEAAVTLYLAIRFRDKQALGRLTGLAFAANNPLPAFHKGLNVRTLEVVATEDVAIRGDVTVDINARDLLGITGLRFPDTYLHREILAWQRMLVSSAHH
jgi:hypothetical protein